jgi:hypothetical protein
VYDARANDDGAAVISKFFAERVTAGPKKAKPGKRSKRP